MNALPVQVSCSEGRARVGERLNAEQDGRPLPPDSNPGKRLRSSGVVDKRGQPRDDAGKEGKRRRETVGEDERGQRAGRRRQARRVRWKDDAVLVSVRLIYKTTEEEASHADLSHEEEGKMLRRNPMPLLEWYCPKRG